jgi:hypothetical protein
MGLFPSHLLDQYVDRKTQNQNIKHAKGRRAAVEAKKEVATCAQNNIVFLGVS